MTRRTVVSIQEFGDMMLAEVVRTPFSATGNEGLHQVHLKAEELPGLETQSSVRRRGEMVRDALCTHKGICNVLDKLATVAPNEVRPLFVMLKREYAEQINWEMLCNAEGKFVALDQRWPIARIVDPTDAQTQTLSEMVTPVRLMAIISALGVEDQEQEWYCLRDAVGAARERGLEVTVKVLVGDKRVRALIDTEIKDGLKNVTLGIIEEYAHELTQTICSWSPHIVHFFCHGYHDSNGQHLELATAMDYVKYKAKDPGTTNGSVIVKAQDLVQLSRTLKNPWLMVLNCCSSGKPGAGMPSLASQAVAAGIPAVVAMMEPVSVGDAYRFTRFFYPATFDCINTARQELTTKSSTTLELTTAMFNVRNALANTKHLKVEDSPHWSLPMLYVRSVDEQVFVRPPEQDHQVRLKVMAMLMAGTRPRMDSDEATQMLETLLSDIPRNLRPTTDGEFQRADS